MVSTPDLNKHRFLRFYLFILSLVLVLIEKIYQTLKTVFDTFPNTSKFVKNTLLRVVFFTLFSVCGHVVKHGLLCLILILLPYLQATMYYFVYYITLLITTLLTIFQRFPNTFQRLFKSCLKARQMFPNIFQKFPKITEDFRKKQRLSKTSKEDLMMWRSYSNKFESNN